MKPYYESPEGLIYHGHALDVLRSMESESVQCAITSPPYWGLRDYQLPPMIWDSEPADICEGGRDHVWGNELPKGGRVKREEDVDPKYAKGLDNPFSTKTTSQFCQICNAWRGCLGLEPTPELYIKHMVETFRELRRVLRNDGTLWLNVGDSYWGSGGASGQSPNHTNLGKTRTKRTYATNGLSQGKKHAEMKPKDLCGIPWMLAFALRADGWWLRSDIIWHKPNPMPESVTDRPTKAHEYIFLLTKSAKYFYDADAIREGFAESTLKDFAGGYGWNDGGKGQELIKNGTHGKGGLCDPSKTREELHNPAGRNKRTVWKISTMPFSGAHFAVFPEVLIEPCILAGTSEKGCCVECGAAWVRVVEKGELQDDPSRKNRSVRAVQFSMGGDEYVEGGTLGKIRDSKTIGWKPSCECAAETTPCTVLDPFGGAMTTAIVAHKHGRKFTMIELSKAYIDDIGIPRIKKVTEQLKLW